jgi:hypothetical protein
VKQRHLFRDMPPKPSKAAQKPLEPPFRFDGDTYEPGLDRSRLTGQLLRVYRVMRGGQWLTLREISEATSEEGALDSEASVSARLRDLRKARFGSHLVDRRRRGEGRRGLHEYRVPRPHEPRRVAELFWPDSLN